MNNYLYKHRIKLLIFMTIVVSGCTVVSRANNNFKTYLPFVAKPARIVWGHFSTIKGDLQPPGSSIQQTAALILDINLDGLNDFVIGTRRDAGPSLVWYERHVNGWTKYLIEDDVLDIEAGGAFYDIDNDNDLDILMGGDANSNEIWWWENPYPTYDQNTSWVRHTIKNDGETKHHDQIFGDFDGDGKVELVFWNQNAKQLFMAEIPTNPKNSASWSYAAIYSWTTGDEHEGLDKADIDGDGLIDIVGGGRWFKHNGGTSFTANVIDDGQRFTRAAVGQLKAGGRPEVVFVAGDSIGRLLWYEWSGGEWQKHDLLGFDVDHGHSLDIVDLDGDGKLDIFSAEMRLNDGNSQAKMWVFFGDNAGNFKVTEVAVGYGNHESKVGDLDGDGDLDILSKPYNWTTPRLDIWLNNEPPPNPLPLNQWQRHVIDNNKPWRALFITAADMDGDDDQDIITGGWWYRNPGSPSGNWDRFAFGSVLKNMAAVYDFDGDNDMDVLGTAGEGSAVNDIFTWGKNNGNGQFALQSNIDSGDGDFLQGVVVAPFQNNLPEVLLSWHQGGKGVQRLTVPANPSGKTWDWDKIVNISQDEALSAGDIDRDGNLDLLLGTKWLQNNGTSWQSHTLFNTSNAPDRNRLADINGDGRLDAVVGYEAVSTFGKLAWYEQTNVVTDVWTEHIIDEIIGPMSLDVADIDHDDDLDVVVGEHNTGNPSTASLFIYENKDGQGMVWQRHVVFTGDEHHDGTQLIDIDGDGDLDIISIGWTHGRVLLYENKAID